MLISNDDFIFITIIILVVGIVLVDMVRNDEWK